jgi:hypothetical protein
MFIGEGSSNRMNIRERSGYKMDMGKCSGYKMDMGEGYCPFHNFQFTP